MIIQVSKKANNGLYVIEAAAILGYLVEGTESVIFDGVMEQLSLLADIDLPTAY